MNDSLESFQNPDSGQEVNSQTSPVQIFYWVSYWYVD